jgi:hypothetical protein
MNKIIIILLVLFEFATIISCKKQSIDSLLKGKLKTIEITDNRTGAKRMLYYYYDSDNRLKSLESDSLQFIIEHIDTALTKIKVNVIAPDPNFDSRQEYQIHINAAHQIASINLLDTLLGEELPYMRLTYNSTLNVDSVIETGQPVFVHDVSNFNYVFDGNNYTKQNVSWYRSSPLGGETYSLDGITYSYSAIPNNNFIPLQQPFLGTAYALTGNTTNTLLLNLMEINGYSVYKRNAKLIKSLYSENYGYITNYSYSTNALNQVVGMTVSNPDGTGVYLTYRMTYY